MPQLAADGPKYEALADAIEHSVHSGELAPGQRLPTQRELADMLGVNVSTITRGYAEAERRGLLAATVGRGTFVASDVSVVAPLMPHEPSAPGLIDMSLGTPLYGLDPDLSEGLRSLARRRDLGGLLQYAPPGGIPAHRKAGADWARRYGLAPTPDQVVICAGSQHGLSCTFNAVFSPGDRVAVCGLTYPGIKTLASMLGIRLAPIAQDEQSMQPESLDAACRREDVRAVYLVPSVQNPTAAAMGVARREELAEVARRHDLTIIEDGTYGLMPEDIPPPVATFAPERTIFLAGVSKVFAAGLRVSYTIAPQLTARRLEQAVLNTIWMVPPLCAEVASLWIEDGTADRVVRTKRAELMRRNKLAAAMLAHCDIAIQPTGFLFWLRLPEPWTGTAFEAQCRAAGINLFGAERFAVGGTPVPAAARVSVSAARSLDELRRGLSILADVLQHGPHPHETAVAAMI